MAIQVLPRRETLGSSLATGLSQGLQGLAQGQLQRMQAQRLQQGLIGQGYSPEEAYSLSYSPELLRYAEARKLAALQRQYDLEKTKEQRRFDVDQTYKTLVAANVPPNIAAGIAQNPQMAQLLLKEAFKPLTIGETLSSDVLEKRPARQALFGGAQQQQAAGQAQPRYDLMGNLIQSPMDARLERTEDMAAQNLAADIGEVPEGAFTPMPSQQQQAEPVQEMQPTEQQADISWGQTLARLPGFFGRGAAQGVKSIAELPDTVLGGLKMLGDAAGQKIGGNIGKAVQLAFSSPQMSQKYMEDAGIPNPADFGRKKGIQAINTFVNNLEKWQDFSRAGGLEQAFELVGNILPTVLMGNPYAAGDNWGARILLETSSGVAAAKTGEALQEKGFGPVAQFIASFLTGAATRRLGAKFLRSIQKPVTGSKYQDFYDKLYEKADKLATGKELSSDMLIKNKEAYNKLYDAIQNDPSISETAKESALKSIKNKLEGASTLRDISKGVKDLNGINRNVDMDAAGRSSFGKALQEYKNDFVNTDLAKQYPQWYENWSSANNVFRAGQWANNLARMLTPDIIKKYKLASGFTSLMTGGAAYKSGLLLPAIMGAMSYGKAVGGVTVSLAQINKLVKLLGSPGGKDAFMEMVIASHGRNYRDFNMAMNKLNNFLKVDGEK